MIILHSRRQFLRRTSCTAAMLGLSDLGFLAGLRPVSASEAALDPRSVGISPEIEPLVRFLEDTPRDRLLEEVGIRIERGLSYRELLAALLLAGVRNIQPRPVGFKFHAVLVVNSAHLASLSSPDTDRWLPIFWALDYFKSSQARDAQEGDWTMSGVNEGAVPPASRAAVAFTDAMDRWDETGADCAAVGLARGAGAQEVFDLFCKYGARDFRDLGHKAIYVANSWRTLQCIGWQHAEPVIRSLAYALLDRGGNANPAENDWAADRPGRRNLELCDQIRVDWQAGQPDRDATLEMLRAIRHGSANDTSDLLVKLLNRGVAPQALWDALFSGAVELLMSNPGIRTLHAVTCTNALHHAFQQSGRDATRRYLLLQTAAFLPLFRGSPQDEVRLDELEPLPPQASGKGALEEIFADISQDRWTAARKSLAYFRDQPQPKEFIDAARVLIFLKGHDAHDYKFSSAVLEDHAHVSSMWRDRFLAASVFNLCGSGAPDNTLVQRTRAALAG